VKLLKDFGVRALLATIAAVGFYGLLGCGLFLFRASLDLVTLVAVLGLAQSPFMAAIAFYFATRASGNTGAPPASTGT
jgi:hypothetical protein